MMNKKSLHRWLAGTSAKGLLLVVLLLGFVISLPFWINSTSEDRQHMGQITTVGKVISDDAIPLQKMPDAERRVLRQMFQPPVIANRQQRPKRDYKQMVWEEDIRQLISRWVKNQDEAQEIAYWTYYYSKHFKISPELVLGLMSVESNFDHFALSNVGARGLMQVMPFWKDKLGSRKDNLFVIETNIRYGCAVLRIYLDKYRSRVRALQAYNGSLGSPKYSNKVIARMRLFHAIEPEKTSR